MFLVHNFVKQLGHSCPMKSTLWKRIGVRFTKNGEEILKLLTQSNHRRLLYEERKSVIGGKLQLWHGMPCWPLNYTSCGHGRTTTFYFMFMGLKNVFPCRWVKSHVTFTLSVGISGECGECGWSELLVLRRGRPYFGWLNLTWASWWRWDDYSPCRE